MAAAEPDAGDAAVHPSLPLGPPRTLRLESAWCGVCATLPGLLTCYLLSSCSLSLHTAMPSPHSFSCELSLYGVITGGTAAPAEGPCPAGFYQQLGVCGLSLFLKTSRIEIWNRCGRKANTYLCVCVCVCVCSYSVHTCGAHVSAVCACICVPCVSARRGTCARVYRECVP